MRVGVVGGLLGLVLACAGGDVPAPTDGFEAQLAELDAQRAALREAETRLVREQLAASPDDLGPETRAMAERLGLDVPPAPPWQPEPLDGRELGIRKDHARAILDGIRREFHEEVDEARWGGAAAEALGVEAWQRPEAAIDQAIAGGMDEAQAVVWGVEAALHGLDSYTRPVWPAQVAAWSQHHEGVVVGAGIELDQGADGSIVVVEIHEDSLAWRAGLHVGDVVVQIDGEPVADLASAAASLAGPPGTAHRVGVRRAGGVKDVEVRSEALPRRTVFGWRHLEPGESGPGGNAKDTYMMDKRTAYVRLTSFVPDTDEELAALVGEGGAEAVIVDLRGNPGGDVQASLNVADAWLDAGVLVSMAGRAAPQVDPPGPGEAAWNEATPGGVFVGACTAVLVDRDTASAAEILAGVLQQRADAIVVGAPTAGKAVSQALRADDQLGVAWQVTNLAWALPDGTTLVAGQGVTPDIPHEPSPAEAWQTARLAAVRQAPKQHPDGTPVPWLGPVVGEGFPELAADPMLVVAQRALARGCP